MNLMTAKLEPDSATKRRILAAYDQRVERLTRNAQHNSVSITAVEFALPVAVVERVLAGRASEQGC